MFISAAVCDFESDSCGWIETANGDEFDWVRSSSSALAPAFQKQAPPQDHTHNKSEGKTSHGWKQRIEICIPALQWDFKLRPWMF